VLSFVAAEPTILLQVPLGRLGPIMQADAAFAIGIGQMADIGTRMLTWIARDLLIPDSSRRLAAVLLRVTAMGEVPPADPSGYVLTQRELSEMANLSRSQVNATLGRFRAAGWIDIGYNRIRLLDVEGLKTFAYSDS
jgi:CRP-like cAMP-binding protein